MLVRMRGWKLAIVLIATLGITGFDGAAGAPATIPPELDPSASDEAAPARFQVLCFLGTECPLAKLYGPRLQELAARFEPQGVRFQGIFSNRQDSPADIDRFVSQAGLEFSVAKDIGNSLADRWNAKRTPEVVVIDASGNVVYRGRIDDQYAPGIARNQPTVHLLSAALTALLQGKEAEADPTGAVGCIIGRVAPQLETAQLETAQLDTAQLDTAQLDTEETEPLPPSITYAQHIAPLLQRHCVECHREGQIGPFAMNDYEEIAGWAETMLETMDQGRMPPWHAAAPHDRFVGSRVVSEIEKDQMRQWIAQGMPAGDLSAIPPAPPYVDGWALSQPPDAVLEMSEQSMEIPASGTVEYQYFVVDPGFTEDRWVRAAQVVPGNPRVVHHAICFVRPPDGSAFRGVGWLGAYVPGQRPAELPVGHARRIPAGSKLVFQMHYTPTGKPETDKTRLGVVFADSNQVTHEVVTLIALDQSFEIPPGATQHPVHASLDRLPANGRLLSVTPHMHYRGSAFTLDVTRVNQSAETLLHVPHYDFNWQHDYRLREPIALQEIERLEFTALFDNSSANPANPDPLQTVTWGEQTWEEMAVAFFDVAEPLMTETVAEVAVAGTDLVSGKRQDFVEQFFSRLDRDSDGKVRRGETPQSFAAFGFWRFDANGDGTLDREEIMSIARERIRE